MNGRPKIALWALALGTLASCGGGGSNRATPTPAPTATATPAPTTTATPAPTATPTATELVGELLAAGLGSYLDILPDGMRRNGAWEEYTYDPGREAAICLRGDPYQVNVRRGTSRNVLLYLEGGGACWNTRTCWEVPTAKLRAGPASGGGILDAEHPDNPLRDWNVVYAPYCDGSVFAGDNVAAYGGRPTWHHGLHNLSAAVALMRREFPDAERIVVAGSSAGGYGTLTGYGVTRVAFPSVPILVFNDSGPGLQNPEDATAIREREENWRFVQHVPQSCERCGEQFTYLMDWALERDPTLRVALFNYLDDPVLQFFLAIDATGFQELLLGVTSDLHDRHPDRFRRFLPAGQAHTVLLSPEFYELALDGVTVAAWTAGFLDGGGEWIDLVESGQPWPGYASATYADPAMWLCGPPAATDHCLESDLTATAVEPDLGLRVEPQRPAEDPEVDCFYVYPTVDLSLQPGNHTDFSDVGPMLDPLLSQAARFTSVCRVFAPLYRQVTIGTFGSPEADRYLDVAYADVREAWRHYMGQFNGGRRFVILGHSQGTFMTERLIQEELDGNPALRERLVSALLIGGNILVPQEDVVGGSFRHVPLCTRPGQQGCAIAFRTYAEGFPPRGGLEPPAGLDWACTNPAALAGGEARLRGAYFPLFTHQAVFRVGLDFGDLHLRTPFVLYEDFYAAACARDEKGRSYLEIRVRPQEGDRRTNPVPFDHPLLSPSFLGTHILDYNFTLGDLVEAVRAQIAAGGSGGD